MNARALDCHCISGNFKALRRVTLLKRDLKAFGIKPERLRLEWVSASEGDKFATVIKGMVEEIKTISPNPLMVGGNS